MNRPSRRAAGRYALVVMGLLVLPPAAAPAQDITGVGAIAGVVRASSGDTVAGVRVCAVDTSSCAISDAQGGFRIPDVRAGPYRLEVLPPDRPPFLTAPITVRAGLAGSIDVVLPDREAVTQTVTVTAPAFEMPAEVRTSGFLVAPRTVLRSAGALQDVSRSLQTLPGVVVGSNDFRNDIIVRGGSPLENLFVVDNVEIPNINTFANFASAGGTVSILDAELLQDVTFLTGGYPAPYANRTSSVLQVTQREGSRDRTAGQATLGFAGAGLIVEGPIREGRGSWIASVRRSFLDVFTDDIGIGGVPVLYTLNAKAVYDLSPRDRVWVVNVAGADRIRLGLDEATDLDEELANFDIRYQGWRSATGLNWQHLFGSRGVGLLGVATSTATVSQQVKDLVRDRVPPAGTPPDEIIAAGPIVYVEDSTERESTIKYDLTLNVPGVTGLQLGGSVKRFDASYLVDSPFGNDTPYSPLPGVDPFSLSRAVVAYQAGAYVQASRALGSRVEATVGGRVDHYEVLQQTRMSPRASLTVRLNESWTWSASTGRYYQQPALLFVAAFPENRLLRPWRADHVVTGLAWQPSPSTRVTVEAYRKQYREYPVSAALPTVSLANIGDTFDVREILFRLVSAGRGTAQGIEFFAEKRLTSRVYGQANVSVSRARHAGLDDVLRPGAFDYPRVAHVVGGYRWSPAWELSLRASWLSGRPFTPFDTATSVDQRRGVYDLLRVNAERAPDYLRLDLRLDRTFAVHGRPVTVFAGVQNVTNRRNFAGYSWNRRTNAEQFGEQQGVFPILGLDWKF